jgi:hypothetical protein
VRLTSFTHYVFASLLPLVHSRFGRVTYRNPSFRLSRRLIQFESQAIGAFGRLTQCFPNVNDPFMFMPLTPSCNEPSTESKTNKKRSTQRRDNGVSLFHKFSFTLIARDDDASSQFAHKARTRDSFQAARKVHVGWKNFASKGGVDGGKEARRVRGVREITGVYGKHQDCNYSCSEPLSEKPVGAHLKREKQTLRFFHFGSILKSTKAAGWVSFAFRALLLSRETPFSPRSERMLRRWLAFIFAFELLNNSHPVFDTFALSFGID